MPKRAMGAITLLCTLSFVFAACGESRDESAQRPCDGPGTGGPRIVYRAEPTPEEPRVTSVGIEATTDVLCKRVRALGAEGARIVRLRGNRIVVRLGPAENATQNAVAVGIPARVAIYDWDANVIGSGDRPLSTLIQAVRRATAAQPEAEPDDLPAAGAEERTITRYDGDAARIQAFYDRRNDATGPGYFVFVGDDLKAGPESSCAGVYESLVGRGRQARGAKRVGDAPDAATCSRRLAARRALPPGATVYVVPRGIRVMAAARPGGGAPGTPPGGGEPEPSAGWYVLEDDAAMTTADVASAEPTKDELTGATGLRLKFTEEGENMYSALTAGIAERGLEDPGGASARLAIGIDTQLLSLTAIDPQANPDGFDPGPGARIPDVGGEARAKLLSKLIGAGPLPLDLRPEP